MYLFSKTRIACSRSRCAGNVDYHERSFQWMEENKPDCTAVHWSEPEKAKPADSRLPRSNTVGSPDVYEHSSTGKSAPTRTGSIGGGRVKQLVADYEARDRRAEELIEEAIRRKREAGRKSKSKPPASSTPEAASTPEAESQTSALPTDLEGDEEDWIQVNKGSDLD